MNFPEVSRRLAPNGASLKGFPQLLFPLKRISPYAISAWPYKRQMCIRDRGRRGRCRGRGAGFLDAGEVLARREAVAGAIVDLRPGIVVGDHGERAAVHHRLARGGQRISLIDARPLPCLLYTSRSSLF